MYITSFLDICGFSRYLSVTDFSFNSIVVEEHTLYGSNLLTFVEIIAQSMIYFGKCFLCTQKGCVF